MIHRLGVLTAAAMVLALIVIRPPVSSSAHPAVLDHDDEDDAILTFSTVGDSRQDPDKPDPTLKPLNAQDKYWLQSTRAFSRILESIHDQKSKILFFNGDMIMGYGWAKKPDDTSTIDKILASDLARTYREYAFWRGMVAGIMERGTYVVPVAGNHETQWKAGGKKAQVENENAWRANMGDLILDETRFQGILGAALSAKEIGSTGGPDGLSSDQSQLTYSFDFGDCHFAVINTDPVGHDAHAPTAWLTSDLGAAQARGARHYFVFGHKPAFTYSFGKTILLPPTPSGLDNDIPARNAFWNVIEAYGAVYFCGHEHIFNMSQPLAAAGGTAWQVIVGSGGSPFEALPTDVTIHPETDRTYAWATVRVFRNGKVEIRAYGFDDQFGETHLIQKVKLN